MKGMLLGAVMLLVSSSPVLGQVNLVRNGDFESGSSGFSTAYERGCPGGAGYYEIVTDARTCYYQFTGHDRHPETGNFMVLNGAMTENTEAWGQRVPVCRDSNYVWSVWVSSVYPASAAQLSFRINSVEVGSLPAPSAMETWVNFTVTWNSGQETLARLSIVDTNLTNGGNDFGLDDISFVGPDCPPMAIQETTWSTLKGLYR